MTYNEEALALYRGMVVERHRIWQRRQAGEPGPWTTDPVLANMKMTNMFRVLDPGSQFVFDLDAPNPVDVISRLVFYRITNLPKTWYMMRNILGRFPVATDYDDWLAATLRGYREAGNRVFSGAYIIVPEPGTANDKTEGAVRLVRRFIDEKAGEFLNAKTQEERFTILRSTPGLGPFLSMQILADWDYLQVEEPDLSFVVAGPGALRGAKILNPDMPARDVIYDLAFEWMDHDTVRVKNRRLTVMDVQNTLCEFSKYAREIAAPRKKTPYKPAHPGAQPWPIVPQWW